MSHKTNLKQVETWREFFLQEFKGELVELLVLLNSSRLFKHTAAVKTYKDN